MNPFFLLAIVCIIIIIIALCCFEETYSSVSIANGFIGVSHLDTYEISPSVYVAQGDNGKSLVFTVSDKEVKCDKLRSAKLYDYNNITIDSDGVWSHGSAIRWLDSQIDTPRNAELLTTTYYVDSTINGTVIIVRLPTKYLLYITPNNSYARPESIMTSSITSVRPLRYGRFRIDNKGIRTPYRDVCITLPIDALYINKNNVKAIH